MHQNRHLMVQQLHRVLVARGYFGVVPAQEMIEHGEAAALHEVLRVLHGADAGEQHKRHERADQLGQGQLLGVFHDDLDLRHEHFERGEEQLVQAGMIVLVEEALRLHDDKQTVGDRRCGGDDRAGEHVQSQLKRVVIHVGVPGIPERADQRHFVRRFVDSQYHARLFHGESAASALSLADPLAFQSQKQRFGVFEAGGMLQIHQATQIVLPAVHVVVQLRVMNVGQRNERPARARILCELGDVAVDVGVDHGLQMAPHAAGPDNQRGRRVAVVDIRETALGKHL